MARLEITTHDHVYEACSSDCMFLYDYSDKAECTLFGEQLNTNYSDHFAEYFVRCERCTCTRI